MVSRVGGTAKCSTKVGIVESPPPLTSILDLDLLHLSNLRPTIGPLIIDGQSDVEITGLDISNPDGACIIVRNSKNIHVYGNQLTHCGTSNTATESAGLQIENSFNVQVDHNFFTNFGPNHLGIFGNNNTMLNIHRNQFNHTSGGIKIWNSVGTDVLFNRFLNMMPRFGVGEGLVQFVSASGANNRIACNLAKNDPAVVPTHGDLINIYTSNGTADSPILVYGNRVIGTGMNLDQNLGTAGIQTGDGSFSSYIKVFWNEFVNVGGSGIWVAGGHDIEIFGNRVYEGGRSATNFTAGLGAMNYYAAPSTVNSGSGIPGAYCRNVKIYDNAITMHPSMQSQALMIDFTHINDWPNCENLVSTNNDVNATLDESVVNSAPAPGCSE